MDTPVIRKGRIILYRLFDVASEINLSLVEAQAREGTKRLRLSKYPYMKALEFTNPPVSFELQSFDKDLFGQNIRVNVIAKAYDFGVISIAFDIAVPAKITFSEIESVSKNLDSDVSIYQKAREYTTALVQTLGSAVISPGIKEEFEEDYMIFFIEEIEPPMDAAGFLGAYDPSRLLLYETEDVSPYTKEETLKHRFSYYPNDLVILHLDNAFVIEPSGSSDIIDILEFANAQLLELRYYDHVLDRELSVIYSELPKQRRVSVFRLRVYERLAKKITGTVADLTEVTEKVNNALKVTEDVYYARVYRTAMMLFRSRDWEQSIKEKLQIVTNTYKMISDEISVRRGHLLELWIIILIVIEIILLMVIEW